MLWLLWIILFIGTKYWLKNTSSKYWILFFILKYCEMSTSTTSVKFNKVNNFFLYNYEKLNKMHDYDRWNCHQTNDNPALLANIIFDKQTQNSYINVLFMKSVQNSRHNFNKLKNSYLYWEIRTSGNTAGEKL